MAWLQEPRLAGIPIGSPRWFEVQREIIRSRPLMKRCYDVWYERLLEDEKSVPGERGEGGLLELGSGSSYLKELCPHVVTSDLVEGVADRVIDGRELPFPDSSLRAIFVTHVFHHIPDVAEFLGEAQRVLVPGGVISMIEVAHTAFAKFFFSRFHPEPYDDRAPRWAFDQGDAMMDANQALSWNVFIRDREAFEASFPELRLERTGFLPWASYLMSGGVTRRNLLPRFLCGPMRWLDALLTPLDPVMSLHWHLTIRRGPRAGVSARSG